MEEMVSGKGGIVRPSFWKGKKVFVTGHTGFKGSWLCMWLHILGSDVSGYALEPPTSPSLFDILNLEALTHTVYGDVRNSRQLEKALLDAKPDIVIHMAAQPLVRYSYRSPVETYEVNSMGTVHLLEAVRKAVLEGVAVKAVVNVTTDKCYENKEWAWGYRETDGLGGYDPYSNSKACSELITSSYRNSFFPPDVYERHGVAIATARAGNVIGGGDWAEDRLIPDCVRSLLANQPVLIRNPHAIRPWQHVLEPLGGYLILAKTLAEEGVSFGESWNFGPYDHDAKPVEWIVRRLCASWGNPASFRIQGGDHPHEAGFLKLDCSKARLRLGWRPLWNLEEALHRIVEWTNGYREGKDVRDITYRQIIEYMNGMGKDA